MNDEKFKEVSELISLRVAQAEGKKIPKYKPYSERKKIKVYTVIQTLDAGPYVGTFRTKKKAVEELKKHLSKGCKRNKDVPSEYRYDFFDTEGIWTGDIYIVEAEI